MTDYTLKIDARETKDIINIFDTTGVCINKPNLKFDVEQLITGDYGFYSPSGKLLFVIERKTWLDLASSIKDGRLDAQLRSLSKVYENDPSVHVFILIEGTQSDYKKKYNRSRRPMTEMITLERKIISLMFSHPFIRFVYSDDHADSVRWILELINRVPCEDITTGGDGEDPLKKAIVKELRFDVAKALMSIRGISVNTADILLNNYSMRDILSTLDKKTVGNLLYKSGTRIGDTRAGKIIKNLKNVNKIEKLLSGIRGISASSAKKIVQNCGDDIKLWKEETLSASKLSEKRKVGKVVGARIMKVINYSIV